jgi:5-methyltetrahydropteroyltriglutamate--homocysteine methyltransferase
MDDPQAYAPGVYARSEALIQATRDLDRARTTQGAVDEQFARDLVALITVQERVGFDLLCDGMLRWQDMFRPLAEASDGVEARPLTRFLDTNTFYRALLIDGAPRLRTPLAAPDLPAGRWLAALPSPLAFSHAADGAASPQAVAAGVLAPQVAAWAADGCALVVLVEPFLAGDAGVQELRRALAELPVEPPIVLQLPFADAGPLLGQLAELPIAGVGIDFYATSLDSVPRRYPKMLLAGVVDVRSSGVEDADELIRFAEALVGREPAGVALVPNGDLQFVPEPIAREKLACLGRSRSALAGVTR